MGPHLELKGKSERVMDACPSKDEVVPKEIEDMTCTDKSDNCEDNPFLTEALTNEYTPRPSEDADINITDSTSSYEKGLSESGSQDATECSSSFQDTDSGVGNGSFTDDVEIESELREDGATSFAIDGFGDLFQKRKKKMTPQWKKFVRPLMWRCKWVELQIRELQTQEMKYDRELAECDKNKQRDLLNFTSEDCCVKSTPISCENRKVHIMKRKRRTRVEEATDVASYMSQHNIFSLLVNKNPVDRPCRDDDLDSSAKPANTNFTSDEFGVIGGWPYLEFKDDNTLEYILQKVDNMQSQLDTLRVRMDKVMSKNSARVGSNIAVSNPCNTPMASPKVLPHINREGLAGSLYITSQNKEDVVVPDSAVSSYKKVAPLPDMIESSDQPHIGPSYQKGIGEEKSDLPILPQMQKSSQKAKKLQKVGHHKEQEEACQDKNSSL